MLGPQLAGGASQRGHGSQRPNEKRSLRAARPLTVKSGFFEARLGWSKTKIRAKSTLFFHDENLDLL